MKKELQQFAYVASNCYSQEPLRTITSFSEPVVFRDKKINLITTARKFIGYIVTASRWMTDLINGPLGPVKALKDGPPGCFGVFRTIT